MRHSSSQQITRLILKDSFHYPARSELLEKLCLQHRRSSCFQPLLSLWLPFEFFTNSSASLCISFTGRVEPLSGRCAREPPPKCKDHSGCVISGLPANCTSALLAVFHCFFLRKASCLAMCLYVVCFPLHKCRGHTYGRSWSCPIWWLWASLHWTCVQRHALGTAFRSHGAASQVHALIHHHSL